MVFHRAGGGPPSGRRWPAIGPGKHLPTPRHTGCKHRLSRWWLLHCREVAQRLNEDDSIGIFDVVSYETDLSRQRPSPTPPPSLHSARQAVTRQPQLREGLPTKKVHRFIFSGGFLDPPSNTLIIKLVLALVPTPVANQEARTPTLEHHFPHHRRYDPLPRHQ